MFQLGKSSRKNLSGVDPRLKGIINVALGITKVDFGIPINGGIRTSEEQRGLFDAGLSKCDGFEIKSCHQSGMAFDVFAYVDGEASWDEYHLTQVAAAMLEAAASLGYQLEWGGHFRNFVDMPHFQLRYV